jgi:type IV secretion system protein VirB1
MKALNVITVSGGLVAGAPVLVSAQTAAQPLAFEKLAAECAPDVHPTTLKGVVSTESAWNPYAIGVVGGRLDRQPRSQAEAIATARELAREGFNFSMGLGQVNRYNLPRYGETYETVFEPCRNLKAGSAILKDCFRRARARIGDDQQALHAALSCYYSGNFTRGLRPDKEGQPSYVQKVVANATGAVQPIPVVPAVKPEGADGAMPVRSVGRPFATLAPWVIFSDEQQQDGQSAALARDAGDREPTVKVRLMTAGGETAPRVEQGPARGAARAIPVQRATPSSTQQHAPFVQFVN